jgi:gliding motility-associated-like protein
MKYLFINLIIVLANCAWGQTPELSFVWSRGLTNSSSSVAEYIDTDALGNSYHLGTFLGTCDLNPTVGVANFTSPVGSDHYLTKLDPNGNYLWTRIIQCDNSMSIRGLDVKNVDGGYSAFITGSFMGNANFNPSGPAFNVTASFQEVFITRINEVGTHLWTRTFNNSGDVASLVVDNANNVIIAGRFLGTVDFDPGVGVQNMVAVGIDYYMLKLNSSGTFQWCKQWASINSDVQATVLQVDGLNRIYFIGEMFDLNSDMDPGAGVALKSAFSGSIGSLFYIKLSSSGTYITSEVYNTPNVNADFVVDNNYDLHITLVAGQAAGHTINIGTVNYVTSTGTSALLIKILTSGVVSSALALDGIANDFMNHIRRRVEGGQDYFYLTYGSTSGAGGFPAGGHIIKYNSLHQVVFYETFSTGNNVQDLALDNFGHVYTCGSYGGITNFDFHGANTMDAGATEDAYVAKYKMCMIPIISSSITVNDQTPCQGSTVVFDAPTVSNVTYAWTGPNGFNSTLEDPSISNITSASSGDYSLILTDIPTGCTSIIDINSTIAISVQPLPSFGGPIQVNDQTPCQGSTVVFDAPTVSNVTYAWIGPNGFTSTLEDTSISNITTAASGTYQLVLTNVFSGCTSLLSANSQVAVWVQALPTLSTAITVNDNTPCVGSTISFNAPTDGHWTYSWSGPNGFTSTLEDPSIASVTMAASGTYTLIIYDIESGCSSLVVANSQIAVTVQALPTLSTAIAVNDNTPCIGSTLSFNGPANVNWTYSWSGPNGFNSTLEDPNIASVTLAVSGIYTLILTDIASSCSSLVDANSQVAVTVQELPVISIAISAVDNTPCIGSTLSFNGPANFNWTYSWSGPNDFTSALEDPSITSVTTLTSGMYYLLVTDMVSGCTSLLDANSSVLVAVQPLPILSTSVNAVDDTPCVGDNLQLNAESNASWTYSWNGPNGFTSTLEDPSISSVNLLASGTYYLLVTDVLSGCTSLLDANSSVLVTVIVNPVLDLSDSVLVCQGDSFTLDGGIYDGYIWSTGEITQTIDVSVSGWYSLLVRDQGCSSLEDSTFVFVSLLGGNIAGNNLACYRDQVNLEFSPNNSTWLYAWSGPNGFNSNFYSVTISALGVNDIGDYVVSVEDTNGCVLTQSIAVGIDPNGDCFKLPEIITPNGDNLNDLFVIEFINQFPNNTLTIYNRYGTEVFSAAPYQNDFSGVSNKGIFSGNGTLPNASYVYVLDLGDDSYPIQGILEIQK